MNSDCENTTTVDDAPQQWVVKEAIIPPSFGRRPVDANSTHEGEKNSPRPACVEDVI